MKSTFLHLPLLALALLSPCCQSHPPAAPATAARTPQSSNAGGQVLWQKEVKGKGAPPSNQDMVRLMDAMHNPNTPAAERTRLFNDMMKRSDHIEGVIKQ